MDQIDSLRTGIDVLVRVLKITDRLEIPGTDMRLNPSDTQALLYIAEKPNCLSGEIGKLLAVAPTTSSTIVDRLVRNGLVSRARTESNRRVVLLSLTPRGKEMSKTVLQEQRRHCEIMLKALPPTARATFVDSIQTIAGKIG